MNYTVHRSILGENRRSSISVKFGTAHPECSQKKRGSLTFAYPKRGPWRAYQKDKQRNQPTSWMIYSKRPTPKARRLNRHHKWTFPLPFPLLVKFKPPSSRSEEKRQVTSFILSHPTLPQSSKGYKPSKMVSELVEYCKYNRFYCKYIIFHKKDILNS